MKKEIAEKLMDYGNNMELYEGYSGRGMYGKTTTAITTDSFTDFFDAVGELMLDMVQDAMFRGEEYDIKDAEELAKVLSNLQQDSMGRGMVIY